MYQVTLKYHSTTVTKTSPIFNDAITEAWLEMCAIALTKYNAINNASLAMQFCKNNTRTYCKILGGN